MLDIGVKRFSSGASAGLSLGSGSGDTDDEFEEERAIASKVESKLQIVIKNLDKEIKARRGLFILMIYSAEKVGTLHAEGSF